MALLLAAAFLSAMLWLLFVGTTQWQEMLIGLISVALTVAFLGMTFSFAPPRLSFHLRDLVQAWRIPWYILSGAWEIAVVWVKDQFAGQRAGSYYRMSGFDSSKRDPVRRARTVLATVYTTAAPNFIVLGVDPEQSRMLFHQIERSSVPMMTQNLGARPGKHPDSEESAQ